MAACALPAAAQGLVSLEFLDDLNVPTGVEFAALNEVEAVRTAPVLSRLERKASGGFGGLSGIAYGPGSKLLYALSDSSKPTVFALSFEIEESESEGTRLRWAPVRVLQLADESGVAIQPWILDPEGIVLTSDGHLFVASEGYRRREPVVDPGIFGFDSRGRLVESLAVPSHYLPRTKGEDSFGVRSNEGFEGLTLSSDGEALFVAMEGPLAQEGDDCGDAEGCEVRILEYARGDRTFDTVAEYLYRLEPAEAPDDFGDSRRAMGLSEILVLDGRRLLTLERGYALAEDGRVHQVIRVYQSAVPLRPTPGVAMLEKRLVLDVSSIAAQFSEGFRLLDNYEGLCLGPLLEDGSRTVLMVSDNNYSPTQRTSLLAFRLVE